MLPNSNCGAHCDVPLLKGRSDLNNHTKKRAILSPSYTVGTLSNYEYYSVINPSI